MNELETLLLQQLEQQQRDSEQLVSGMSAQLRRLQTALNQQQKESQEIRRVFEESDRQNAELIEHLTERVEELTQLLNALKLRSNK